jgi:hypothetical protein
MIMGWPRAFKYIIFSGVYLVNLGSEGNALPRIGRPFGPGGTFRHGLLAYCAATSRMSTAIKMRPPWGVRCWESAANEIQWGDSRVLQLRVVAEPGIVPTFIAVMM